MLKFIRAFLQFLSRVFSIFKKAYYHTSYNTMARDYHHQQERTTSIQEEQQGTKESVNQTGIPDNLKASIEYMSGFSLDAVRVHYNSEKPATMGALAYTEGTEVYLAPGQEQYLGHELWHIVQQMKKEVKENVQFKEGAGNNEKSLEEEATKEGEEALKLAQTSDLLPSGEQQEAPLSKDLIQLQEEEQEEGDPIGKGTVVKTNLLALRSAPHIPDLPKDNNTIADLEAGTVLNVLKDAGNNFYEVEALVNGQSVKGYVGKHYIEVMTFPAKYSSFEEDALAAKARAIENRLMTNYIAYDPRNLDWNISDEDVEFALTQIQQYYDTLSIQEFTILMMHLKQSGKLDVLFEQLDQQHMIKHYELIVRIAVYLSPDKAISMAQMQMVEEISELAIKEGLKAVFRYPTLDNPNPIDVENFQGMDKEAIKQAAKEQLEILLEDKNQQQIIQQIDENVKALMELKTAEIRYHLEKGNTEELRQQLIEVDKLADAALELLFSDNPQNEYLTQTLFYPLLPIWDELKSTPESGTVYPYGMADGRKLEDVFDTNTQQLIPQTTSNSTPSTSVQASPSTTTPTTTTTTAPRKKALSTQAKTFIKELIVKEAETIHQFFYKDILELGYEYEHMVPTINKIIEEDLKPQAYQKLKESGVEMDDTSNNDDINKVNLDWMDLVRIWYYELGREDLGSRSNKLTFGPEAATTQAIRDHATVKDLVAYAKARVANGDFSTHRPFVHYDVSGFYKAIASKDTTFNLLGSFTVVIEPNQADRTIKFTIKNTSGKESATRFRRDNSRGRANKVGMFEDTERGEEGVPHLGGNLACEWSWTETF